MNRHRLSLLCGLSRPPGVLTRSTGSKTHVFGAIALGTNTSKTTKAVVAVEEEEGSGSSRAQTLQQLMGRRTSEVEVPPETSCLCCLSLCFKCFRIIF